MAYKWKATPQDVVAIVAMATIQHLTPSEIGLLIGVSRQWVLKMLKQAGVNTSKGPGGATRVTIKCAICGKTKEITRKDWKLAKVHYCSRDCYYASRSNPNYYQSRHGQRLARIIISQYYQVLPEHIPHHIDGNDINNDRSNLLLFASQSDHMKHHHGKNHVEPLWDGRLL